MIPPRREKAMAPPPPAACAAAADGEPLEVRCAGCGETLEVDRGLTEFICPDCATPQSLPPELMPPPPPRRKALPLPRGAADLRGARLPCGACGALLSVPVGLPRCACPLCGAELAVDTARLRHYLLSSAAAADAVPVVPLGASSSGPPILQPREAQTERPNWLIAEQAESEHPDYMVDREKIHGVNQDTARYKEQRNIYSGSPRIVSAENRHGEPLNQVRHQPQDLPSSHAVHTKQTYQESPDRVTESLQNSANSALFKKSGCISHINDTTITDINGRAGSSICPKTVNLEKRNMQTPKQIKQKPQKQLSCYVTSLEHARAESANRAIHVQEKQQEPANEANRRENACTRLANETIADNNNRRRTRQLIGLNATGADKNQGQTPNNATQQVWKERSDSVICRELDNQVTLESKQPGRHRVHIRKRKGLLSANSGLQLRRSKRLAKDSSATIDRQPVMDAQLIHRQTVGCQAASPNRLMPIATIYDERTESEPDEQWTASPVPCLSDPPDTDRTINNLCTSSFPSHEIRQTSCNELENLHSTPIPSSNPDMSDPEHFSSNPDMSDPEHFSSNPDMSDPEHFSSNPDMSDPEHFSSNPDMSDPEQFARTYIPMDVRRALAKLSSKSLIHHMMSQPSSGESYMHDSMDSEGQDVQLASQNKGRRPRGSTLCLKLWTMPKGMRIPVSLNASGLPIGKEAATLSSFLGTLARDGILAPLSHLGWKNVPEKNKDVMRHIVKLKFDIAPVGELWIVKNLGKKWKSWKSILKQKHFDAHETEEERLADRNPRVLEEQWRFLVEYWSTEKAQVASARNKACQANVTTYHSSGTKSFARRIEEERQKRPNNDEPTVEDLFILTHTPKDGKPMTKAAADTIERFRQQCQKQTEGSGSDFGLESRATRRRRKPGLKASLREAMEAKRKAEDEAASLWKKLIAMEERQKKVHAGKADMKGADGPVNSPEERAGEPSSPPGFQQVQNTPSSDKISKAYLSLRRRYPTGPTYFGDI
ncbi:hypothetical protein GQ55_7G277500 [Panicum hallii var. hallii]|uniref:Uncharacterized protein n=1 Tax=Panicum hallii var. hallii TaxID=1504633 RepID=A0A2T7CZR0_9POAL|nr:hypothetical protein GQ55_7G277500 [Panicum hallii var. hallii]